MNDSFLNDQDERHDNELIKELLSDIKKEIEVHYDTWGIPAIPKFIMGTYMQYRFRLKIRKPKPKDIYNMAEEGGLMRIGKSQMGHRYFFPIYVTDEEMSEMMIRCDDARRLQKTIMNKRAKNYDR